MQASRTSKNDILNKQIKSTYEQTEARDGDIAVIGMACRLPGAKNYAEFWRNLEQGVDSIRKVPPERWDEEEYNLLAGDDAKNAAGMCGLLENIDRFDNRFFNISPREATCMDPQQRLLLEETWHCVEDSGVPLEKLQKSRTCVCVGAMAIDYYQNVHNFCEPIDGYAGVGVYHCLLSNRISYFFGLSGESKTIDTACSSSLVALNDARQALTMKACDYAIVAGVNLNVNPSRNVMWLRNRMLSPDGKCKTFDKDADGFVSGEGVGVLLLQPLGAAVRDNNRIYAVIKGSAVNHCGKSISLTAPKVEAQKNLLIAAYDNAGFSPETVTYIEAHGTGTSLGDPIEIEALTQAFRKYTNESQFCRIGSVKTNIGHLESASGIAGVIKVILMMKYKKIPGNLNFKTVNPIIDFENSPFILSTGLTKWDRKEESIPRRAGVNSFGFSGANAHIVLEENNTVKARYGGKQKKRQLFVLSAKTRSSLEMLLDSWKSFVDSDAFMEYDLKDISHTLLSGRGMFEYRYGKCIKDKDELRKIIKSEKKDSVFCGDYKWVMRIGEYKPEDYMHFYKSLKENAIFMDRFNSVLRTAENINESKSLLRKDIGRKIRADTDSGIYSFAIGYALCESLLELGFMPHAVCGGKTGVWVALAVSGMMKPEDILAVLYKKKDIRTVELIRPSIAYYDSVTGKVFHPCLFSENYLCFLLDGLNIQGPIPEKVSADSDIVAENEDVFVYIVNKARVLNANQFAFRKLLSEWDAVIKKASGPDIIEMLYDEELLSSEKGKHYKEKLLLILVIMSSLRKLNLKWNLQERKLINDEKLYELLDILTDEVMPRETLVELLIAEKPDYAKAASILNERIGRIDPEKPYKFLKEYNRGIYEVKDIHEWLQDALKREWTPYPDNVRYVNFGICNEIDDDSISFASGSGNAGRRDFDDCLLGLWLNGVDIKWDKYTAEQAFNKVALPTYEFDRESFWLKRTGWKAELEKSEMPGGTGDRHIPGASRGSEDMGGKLLFSKTENLLKGIIAEETSIPVEKIDSKTSFEEYGIDSIIINGFNTKIEKYVGNISKTLFFEYECLKDLTEYFVNNYASELGKLFNIEKGDMQAGPGRPGTDNAAHEKAEKVRKTDSFTGDINEGDTDIAIIGISGRYPGAGDVNEFWENLKSGKDCIDMVPEDRWDYGKYFDSDPMNAGNGKMYCKWGGFIDDVDKFDPLFFNISPREAANIDPQERIMLQMVWAAFEDAGYTRTRIKEYVNRNGRGDVGVFIGAQASSYRLLAADAWNRGNRHVPNAFMWSIANRISYFFDFKGPSMPVDTACSSSLAAVHLACGSLKKGECSLAVAGGVNLFLHPADYVFRCQLKMLSPSGRCHTFGEKADGYVPGEGAGAILLKPFRNAVRDNDNIYAVIKGSAINHGGKTNGYTVPNPNAQAELVLKAAEYSEIDLGTVSCIEAHGTGTSLGDPVEINGLTKAFRVYTDRNHYCSIGSVKTNIGHLEAASGIAGLTKLILQLKNKQLVPSLHAEKLNPNIHWDNTPFYVQKELCHWTHPAPGTGDDGKACPRRAGISSFGAGGTNVHVILEEYDEPLMSDCAANAYGEYVFVLSARGEERLNEYVRKMAAYLDGLAVQCSGAEPVQLTERIIYTLQVGREPMEERLAIVINGINDLKDKLGRYCKGETGIENLYRGNARENGTLLSILDCSEGELFVKSIADNKDLNKLARLWVNGLDIKWEKLYPDRLIKCISLPAYPFEKKRYWIESMDEDAPGGGKYAEILCHPGKQSGERPEITRESAVHIPEDIRNKVREKAADVLFVNPWEIDFDIPLQELGMDSILGVQFIKELNNVYGLDIKATELYNYPTVNNLAGYLASLGKYINRDNTAQVYVQKSAMDKSSPLPRKDAGTADKGHITGKTDENIRCTVKALAAKVLCIEPDELDDDVPLQEMGMDSILGVELMKCINQRFGLDVRATELYNYPTITVLSYFIKEHATGRNEAVAACRDVSLEKQALNCETRGINYMGCGRQTGYDAADVKMEGREPLRIALKPKNAEGINSEETYRIELKSKDREAIQAGQTQKDVLEGRQDTGRITLKMKNKCAADINDSDIAVIGISGRFPKARNVREFWNNLQNGVDCVMEVPEDRWSIRKYYDPDPDAPGKTYCKWGGFIDDVDKFDPLFFNISPMEAEIMDPQQRLFLEEAWRAIEDSGYAPDALSDMKCGVFVGVSQGDYSFKLKQTGNSLNGRALLGTSAAVLAARISYFLNLNGPSMAIDTACSSSLVAIHQGCESIRRGESEIVLAGGVFVQTMPDLLITTSKLGMLSKTGKCRTFDNDADGFVPGEGVGVVVLKKLSKAIEDNDYIYGVIKGSAINQDGKTNGISAPSGNAQASLEKEVYDRFGINPGDITYIEAHGTGTKLGDPIEVNALIEAFSSYTSKKRYCALGSVKTVIGHALSAAGVASLIKVLLCLKFKKLVPSLNFKMENEHINFKDSPFYVNTELKEWVGENNKPRMAAISSFGFSGTNCHIVVSETPVARTSDSAKRYPCYMIPFSAKTRDSLNQIIREFLNWPGCEDLRIEDMAYTLHAGRNHFAVRLALLARDMNDFRRKLKDLLEKGRAEDCYISAEGELVNTDDELRSYGAVVMSRVLRGDCINEEEYRNDLAMLADLYVKNVDLDWRAMYKGCGYYRVPLPVYCFARDRCWVEGDELPETAVEKDTMAVCCKPCGQGTATERMSQDAEAKEDKLESCLDKFFYQPGWIYRGSAVQTDGENRSRRENEQGTVVIFHTPGSRGLEKLLASAHHGSRVSIIKLGNKTRSLADNTWEINAADPRAIHERIKSFETIDTVYFLGLFDDSLAEENEMEMLEEIQEKGVISCYRLIRALNMEGWADKHIAFKVITNNIYKIKPEDTIIPYAGGLIGLIKVGAKEYVQWDVTCMDICLKEFEGYDSEDKMNKIILPVVTEPGHKKGEELGIRDGSVYMRVIKPVALQKVSQSCLREKGVYLILGGAGRIGSEMALYLARNAGARLILVGRSRPNKEINDLIDRIEKLGGKAVYCQADGDNAREMENVVNKAKAKYGHINGVVHSAIIFRTETIANMDEDTFRSVLRPKVEATVALEKAVRGEPLDFYIYFSSGDSFTALLGHSAYVAGCTFADCYALYQQQKNLYPVKVINWGFWEASSGQLKKLNESGLKSNTAYLDGLESRGIELISPEIGMEAVARVMGNPVTQVFAMKVQEQILKYFEVDLNHKVEFLAESAPSLAEGLSEQLKEL
jgi:acyl transferase domain-containing protein/acyl carrier protein/short-subunit dehydrogenase involved in D-alanine esterification of teichoic acids